MSNVRALSVLFACLAVSPSFAGDAEETLLRELVELNSGSLNVEGVRKVQNRIEKELVALGMQVSRIENPLGADRSGPLLVGVLPGKRGKKGEERFVSLIVHADTVFEPHMGFLKYSVSADGKELLGPGVGDDKGGIVIALAGLKQLVAGSGELPYSIRFISCPNEEVGSTGFGEIFKAYGRDSVMALGFEDAPASGAIARSRSQISKYQVKIRGKEAHAGTNHADGANACVELAAKLVALAKLTDHRKGITVNPGSVAGGSEKTNIVCGSAETAFEARTRTPQDMDALEKKIEKVLKTTYVRSINGGHPTTTEFTLSRGRPSFPLYPKSKPYVERYREILGRIESRKIEGAHMAGSADVSFLAGPDVIAIDDLGPIGGAAHTTDERILRSSLDTRPRAFVEFMRWFFEESTRKETR